MIKAAVTKALIPFGAEVARELDNGTPEKHARAMLLHYLARFVEIIEGEPIFCSTSAQQELEDVVNGFLLNYAFLARASMEQGKVLWQVVPKHHYFAHFAYIAKLINPRMLRVYCEESMIGRICNIYSGCKHGPYHRTVQKTVLTKYLLALQLAFSPFS